MFSWRCFPFVESAPRAYRLKASNAAPLSSTSAGTFPGTSEKGDKDFTASAGEIGTLKGKNTKLRVSIATVNKTKDFSGKWKGSIAFNFAGEGEGVISRPFKCTYDEKAGGYHIFNIVG
jgi:hypothetical protein